APGASFTKSISSDTPFYYRVYARNGDAPCNVDGPYSAAVAVRVVPRPPLAPGTRVIPGAGSAAGALGSFFRTSLQLHNPGEGTLRGTIRFHPQATVGSDGDPSMTYTIPTGETLSWSDLLPA